MKLDPEVLLGPARDVLDAAWETVRMMDRGALLLEGNPGTGKTDVCDRLARRLAMSEHAIEHVNGQSVGVELVRAWRTAGMYGNLFSNCTVKRIDELDFASSSAVATLATAQAEPHSAFAHTRSSRACRRDIFRGAALSSAAVMGVFH